MKAPVIALVALGMIATPSFAKSVRPTTAAATKSTAKSNAPLVAAAAATGQASVNSNGKGPPPVTPPCPPPGKAKGWTPGPQCGRSPH
jgi:hypothetical protein